eukprot:TRINITY_DN9487_c1_g1_i1.p1 TRINITY_DN9487_c1_g1~~TRINITY_DN9487_c1_g1_i1.p1  ORF type:complete len:653 (-),score=75.29 TRINITY_DN9487_c1_g1_i1:44-2002(-)
MPESLTSNRIPFRELLKLVGHEYDTLRQECDLYRSRCNLVGQDFGHELKRRGLSEHDWTLASPCLAPTQSTVGLSTAARAKSCHNRCLQDPKLGQPVALGLPLVGKRIIQPKVLKAATEDGPMDGPTLMLEAEGGFQDKMVHTDGPAGSEDDVELDFETPQIPSTRSPKFDLDRTSFFSPVETMPAVRNVSRPTIARGTHIRRSTVNGIEPRCDRVMKTLQHIKSSAGSEGCPNESLLAESLLVRLVRDRFFLNVVVDGIAAIVIVVNIVYMGMSTEMAENHPMVFGGDLAFATVFILERILKLYIFGIWGYFVGKDRVWNIFELLLSFVAAIEVGLSLAGNFDGDLSSPILRLIRLSRIAKIVRVLRLQVCKELMLMVTGILGGMRTLLWSFVLICIPLYAVAMLMRETAGRLPRAEDDGTENFSTLSSAFYTMFRCVVGGDCSDETGRPIFLMLATNHGWHYAGIYMLTVLLMTFGLFNVIIALYVENTVAAAKYNQMVLKHHRLQNDQVFKEKAKELLDLVVSISRDLEIDHDGVDPLSIRISADFFEELCEHSRFRDILCELDVAEENQTDLFETLDVDGGGTLDAFELINGINKLRGDPRRADVISVGLTLRSMLFSFQKFEREVVRLLRSNNVCLNSIRDAVLKDR